MNVNYSDIDFNWNPFTISTEIFKLSLSPRQLPRVPLGEGAQFADYLPLVHFWRNNIYHTGTDFPVWQVLISG